MKKMIAATMAAAMLAVSLVGCGTSGSSTQATKEAGDAQTASNGAASKESVASSDYPAGPVTIVIPYSPGGGSDILTRKIMDYIELPNNAKLVPVNVDGASGYIGCMQTYNSKNDGYTIMAHNPMDVISYTLSGSTDIPLWDKLTNICGIADDFNIFVTNPKTGWKTVEDAVAYINAHPGEVKVGNTGSNNSNMADCLRVLDALKIRDKVTVVPYDGGAENKTALMGNHIQLSVNTCVDIQSAIHSGDHVALMTIGDRRAKALPDVPCTKELGYNIVTTKPRGWYGPAGMDAGQVKVLQDACKKVCDNEQFQKEILELGLEINYVDGTEFHDKTGEWYAQMKPYFEEMQKDAATK